MLGRTQQRHVYARKCLYVFSTQALDKFKRFRSNTRNQETKYRCICGGTIEAVLEQESLDTRSPASKDSSFLAVTIHINVSDKISTVSFFNFDHLMDNVGCVGDSGFLLTRKVEISRHTTTSVRLVREMGRYRRVKRISESPPSTLGQPIDPVR